MTQYRALAYHRLSFSGDGSEVDDGIVEFMEKLCQIEEELLDLERKVSSQNIDTTGWRASKNIGALESEHASYLNEIGESHEAVITGHLSKLDRNPYEKGSERTQEAVYDFRDDLIDMVNRMEDISDRIGRRIDAKRNSANTRLILSVSAVAAVISLFALLSQIVGVIF